MTKISKHKSKITAIASVLLMASVVLTLYTPVNAQIIENPGVSGPLPVGAQINWTHTGVQPRLSFTPNPIGVGQTLLVNCWVTPPPSHQRYMKDYKIVITDPDGNEETILQDSYVADGTTWFPYVVDKVGEWTLQFHFQGMYFPEGYWDDGNYSATAIPGWVYYEGDYYPAKSTPEQTLTVQEELVMSWHRDLPTDYWERPISLENREWYAIAGNYPWDEFNNAGIGEWSGEQDWYGPYVTAPNTSHIAWKKLGPDLAGLIGGETGVYGRLDSPSMPNVIFMGRVYDTYYKPGVGNVAGCWNLRTGEIIYEIPTADGGVTPTNIAYYKGIDPAVPGAEAAVTYSPHLVAVGGPSSNRNTLYKINPATGAVSDYNIQGAGRIVAFHKGYFLSFADPGTSAVRNWMETHYWNETDITIKNGYPTYMLNWSVIPNTNNFAARIEWNRSFTLCPSYRGSAWPPSSRWRYYGTFGTPDLSSGITCITRRFFDNAVWGGSALGVSLTTGEVLWERFFENAPYSPSTTAAEDGVFVICFNQGEVVGLDMRTGAIKWTNKENSYPYGGFWGYDEATAYGNAYFWSYDGVQAFNLQTGETEWHYNHVAVPFETPYLGAAGDPAYSFNGPGVVADGKVYTCNSEHTTTHPVPRGWSLHCIDAFTGEGIWKIAGQISPGPASDGYLLGANSYDGHLYCFGKGKSATTIEAPLTAISLGQSVVLKGTVLDQSPGQPGTPCVSKESMDDWMNYIHMQRPIPTNVTGVPVSLDTLDPNGNFIHIADITTDGYSGTFGYTWTPEVPGTYAVMATFMGDESYGSSFAQTYVGVGEAPEPYPEPPEYGSPEWPEYPEAPAYTSVDLAIIAAIVVVALLVVYDIFFRKQR